MRDSVSYLDNLLHYIINTYILALVFTYFIVGRLRALISLLINVSFIHFFYILSLDVCVP